MQNKEKLVNNIISIWQEKEKTKYIPAEGISMYPLIKDGDSIPVNFIKADKVKVGDIVAFRRGNTTIVHRLIKRDGTEFIEKGDFQVKGTSITHAEIFGIVKLQPHVLNYIISFFEYIIHKLGRVAKPLLILPLILNAGTRIYLKMHSRIRRGRS